ncbi:purine-nucleoside phosphorylase [Dongia deserti]|uniref:purine-nucleoside phosphorylase n=1 Tax=Dongia deserti TaxID=2268030 RepID=UPI000E657C0E|nr:purine-nucleoside phosphorylase [Dongia deserti]
MKEAAGIIAAAKPGFKPNVGIILGSGLGPMAQDVTDATVLDYRGLPGFPQPSVEGHAGLLSLGKIGETAVAVLQGRGHFYEHGRADAMKVPVRALHAIGCETLILTNAGGSLDPAMGPGSVMMITDHINLVQSSPLFDEAGNSRFVDMVGAYDAGLQQHARDAAQATGVMLHEGIYVWFSGPQFETAAEIRFARMVGGTAIGMSTVPEVILARQAGMKVAGFSIITNFGAGMSDTPLSHEQTMSVAATAAVELRRLLNHMIAGLGA